MPAARIVINSPTTHGAIGFSTDLAPSMTLGCGSWGGNVTSDNVSPIHLMDIKRVAFETKPVSRVKSAGVKIGSGQPALGASRPTGRTIKRAEIAALVDKFLSKKITESPEVEKPVILEPPPVPQSPVKTIIHELRPQNESANGAKPSPVDFVSEDDVRKAVERGNKIYITAKTILTPSARDLGEEKEIFAKV
jgi:acetaldehyde dehydrogenase (acetylating)